VFQLTQEQDEQLQKRLQRDQALLDAIKARMPELERLRLEITAFYEDGVYRFYHNSFKVYSLQNITLRTVEIFKRIAEASGNKLCGPFEQIVREGTGQEFEIEHNARWADYTRPIVEAYLHTKYFWEMMTKYATELESAPAVLPDGWAAILELYNQR
jgi:hypothetical protein